MSTWENEGKSKESDSLAVDLENLLRCRTLIQNHSFLLPQATSDQTRSAQARGKLLMDVKSRHFLSLSRVEVNLILLFPKQVSSVEVLAPLLASLGGGLHHRDGATQDGVHAVVVVGVVAVIPRTKAEGGRAEVDLRLVEGIGRVARTISPRDEQLLLGHAARLGLE